MRIRAPRAFVLSGAGGKVLFDAEDAENRSCGFLGLFSTPASTAFCRVVPALGRAHVRVALGRVAWYNGGKASLSLLVTAWSRKVSDKSGLYTRSEKA